MVFSMLVFGVFFLTKLTIPFPLAVKGSTPLKLLLETFN